MKVILLSWSLILLSTISGVGGEDASVRGWVVFVNNCDWRKWKDKSKWDTVKYFEQKLQDKEQQPYSFLEARIWKCLLSLTLLIFIIFIFLTSFCLFLIIGLYQNIMFSTLEYIPKLCSLCRFDLNRLTFFTLTSTNRIFLPPFCSILLFLSLCFFN